MVVCPKYPNILPAIIGKYKPTIAVAKTKNIPNTKIHLLFPKYLNKRNDFLKFAADSFAFGISSFALCFTLVPFAILRKFRVQMYSFRTAKTENNSYFKVKFGKKFAT